MDFSTTLVDVVLMSRTERNSQTSKTNVFKDKMTKCKSVGLVFFACSLGILKINNAITDMISDL